MSAETIERELGAGAKLFVQTSHVLPIVAVVVALRTGAAHDPAGKEGLSRATARMLRRGCEGLDAIAVERSIDALGGEVGFEVAASSTAVSGQVLARNLEPFVDLVAKMIGKPTFAQDEVDRLLRETRAELLESLDNDRGLADRHFRRRLFAGHPYGRTSRGTSASLAAIDRDAIRGHHAANYVRGNVVVAMSGDVAAEEAERLARKLVDALPQRGTPTEGLAEPPVLGGRHLVFVDKPERTQTQILIGGLGTEAHDPDHIALTVANAIFGGTFTSRLTREVRGKRGWSYGASSRLGVDRRRHSFLMWTFPAASDAAPCAALEIDLLEKLVAGGVTEREVRFIQRYLTRSWAFEVDTAQKRVHHALDVELLGLPGDYYSGYLDHIGAVTPDTANAALSARIHPSDLVVTVVGTAATTLDAIRAAIPSLATEEVVPYDHEAKEN
ncbi:MAG TPA: pitrilysin family protein [Polyangiaceae bacterium]